MIEINEKISSVKTSLNDLIYQIGQGMDHKSLHGEALAILMSVNELEQLLGQPSIKASPQDLKVQEINKVRRKLKRWVHYPDQINTIILNCYLDLIKKNNKPATRKTLKDMVVLNGIKTFDGNFPQMSHFGPKNHAKIFELEGEVITIWEPVKSIVDQYIKTRDASR